MQRPQHSRIDLGELKALIVKKIGVEKSRRYFYYLSRFLSRKLTKSEFDKFCHRLLGRENLPLHNQLIRSILRNASLAKSPPPAHVAGHLAKPLVQTVQSSPNREEHSGSLLPNHSQNDLVCSNGVLSMSTRKVRSVMQHWKTRDRPSPLGPNGKVESLLHQPVSREDNSGTINMENGDLGHSDYHRASRFVDESDRSFLRPVEKPSIPSKDQVATTVTKGDKEEEKYARLNLWRSPLVAPLGIPFCSASVGGARRTASTSPNPTSCYDSGGLSDTEMLRKRMENIAVAQGLGGVSLECANMLNNMLDVYLKKLIKSCIDLVGARSKSGMPRKQILDNQHVQNKVVNGVCQSNNFHLQNSYGPLDTTQDQQHSVSLLDFRVAMELNPHQLGEDWPLLRERICMRLFDEQELGV
ncbi:PREDICTED: uncharacterized protein LOC104803873 [Tarenaya hassleriana]|uniref:uncharacterized protein LOC104803873 n=1 Tax=Tarenaya hassleriana TaxID=28532 RepID=UPI00053C7117|nr:PREDICTED: uncharacterized protein LOC104803873 [Tarenaya hassleriana]